MDKFGTYTIIIALIMMLLPDIFSVFGVEDLMTEPIYPMITIALGGVGVILHVLNLFLRKQLSFSAITLLISVALIISGVSLSKLEIANAHYLTLIGLLLVALWIAVPQKKRNKKADQN